MPYRRVLTIALFSAVTARVCGGPAPAVTSGVTAVTADPADAAGAARRGGGGGGGAARTEEIGAPRRQAASRLPQTTPAPVRVSGPAQSSLHSGVGEMSAAPGDSTNPLGCRSTQAIPYEDLHPPSEQS